MNVEGTTFIVVKSDLEVFPPLKSLLPVFDFQWYRLENTGEFFVSALELCQHSSRRALHASGKW